MLLLWNWLGEIKLWWSMLHNIMGVWHRFIIQNYIKPNSSDLCEVTINRLDSPILYFQLFFTVICFTLSAFNIVELTFSHTFILTLFFPMFPFGRPENIGKRKDRMWTLGRNELTQPFVPLPPDFFKKFNLLVWIYLN